MPINTLFSISRSFFTACVFTLLSAVYASSTVYAAKDTTYPAVAAAKVSVNAANAELLAEVMKGVGIKKAAAIVAYRKTNGKFKSLDDLALVKGIGAETIKKNRTKLSL